MQTAYTRYAEKIKGDKDQWPPKFWKFQLETDSNPKVDVAFTDARRFGRIRLVDCPGGDIRKHSPLKENGPDPVIDKDVFTEEYLRTKMKSRHVPIKALLLDQTMISGIGNWVGDEIMWQAKMHPEQYSDDFSDADIKTLYKAVKYVCDTAVGHLGNSDEFPEDWLFHFRWGKGKKDSVSSLPTGEKLTFITVGGRTSCIVPSLQKKRGKTTGDEIKDEVENQANGVGAETESKFFDGEENKKASSKAKTKGPGGKANVAKRKAVKDEEDEAPHLTAPKKAKSSKSDEGDVKPQQDTNRRRSGRLSGKV
jgi:formamidopyrimidine-DNA glycosylase